MTFQTAVLLFNSFSLLLIACLNNRATRYQNQINQSNTERLDIISANIGNFYHINDDFMTRLKDLEYKVKERKAFDK